MLTVTIETDPLVIGNLVRKFPQETEHALQIARDKLLDAIELIQIHKYLSDSFPPLPSGSNYRRTFTLRRSSKTRRAGDKLPDIGGVWWADESIAPYAEEVIGPTSRQRRIHRGRWLSLEEISAEAEQIAGPLVEETLQNEMDF